MRLLILGDADGWHGRDLLRAAVAAGHAVLFADFRTLAADVRDPFATIPACDAVVVRTMPAGSLEQVVVRMDWLGQLHRAGVRVVNPPAALETCIDKYLSGARLAAAGVPVPDTRMAQTTDAALEAFASLGGDVVVKPLFGSEGRGMVRVTDADIAWRVFTALERVGAVLLLQRFVPHGGWDARAFVVGGRVTAAMRRDADDWRTNAARGGRCSPLTLDDGAATLAVRAAAVLGTEVAGVDLVWDGAGWLVLEANAVPGWRALNRACGVDAAAWVVGWATR